MEGRHQEVRPQQEAWPQGECQATRWMRCGGLGHRGGPRGKARQERAMPLQMGHSIRAAVLGMPLARKHWGKVAVVLARAIAVAMAVATAMAIALGMATILEAAVLEVPVAWGPPGMPVQ